MTQGSPVPGVALGESEAAVLGGYLDRILRWDRNAAVRVVTRPQALGCYAAPPMGVLAFLAVPANPRPAQQPAQRQAERPAQPSPPLGEDGDLTCSAAALRAALAVAPGADGERVVVLPGPVAGTAALADLPPADGWHLPIPGVSGDLVVMVDQAVAAFRTGAAADPAGADALAERIWDSSMWAGLPARVLHCARLLGFLPADGSRVAASTAGPWKRLTTGRGQVFVRSGATVGHLTLLPQP